MSNYAPDPKDEKVYRNLQNKTLSNVGAEDIQKLTDPTFIQATNQDALITYNIVNSAAMRDGLPIPGTSVLIEVSATDSGVQYEVKSPNDGEVWMIMNGQVFVTSPTGNIQHEFYYTDKNNSRSMMWYFTSSASSNLTLQADTDWTPPFFFDSNQTFYYEANGTFTESKLRILMMRVR
mgnify:CR=1 FL=1